MEFLHQPEKSDSDRQIEAWKRGPVILASGSTFRLDRLQDEGFIDVTPAESIPEIVETDRAAAMAALDGAPQTHHDSDGRNFSEHIAAEKVQYVLDTVETAPNALVVGFDTTSVMYDQPTDEHLMGIPTSAEKYTSLEDARLGMLQQFKLVAAGITERQIQLAHFREIQERIGGSVQDIDDTVNAHAVGMRRGTIFVITGVAVVFPHEPDSICRFSEEIRLYSIAIAESEENEPALEKLVDLIIETQGEQKTLSISGGIDYADSYVRDILKVQEESLFETTSDERLYRGFAPKALETILRIKADEMGRNKVAN